MNACEMFYDPSKSALQMLQMLAKDVGNLSSVLRMKRECKTWVSNLHNYTVTLRVFLVVLYQISLFSFKFHIRPAFCGNVNTNARESLQTSYDHYKCIAIRMAYGCSGICCE